MPAKSKKAETPQEPKKAAKGEEKAAKKSTGYHVMDNPEAFAEATKAAMDVALGRRKGREVHFTTQSELLIPTLPLRSLYFQWMINNRGLPKGFTNVVAKDSLGKTSFVYNLFGGFLLGGHPCAMVVCEGKGLESSWAARCMSNNAAMANKMCASVHVLECRLLDEFAEVLETWAKVQRNPKSPAYVPDHVTLILAADPINKLNTAAQAAGIALWDGKDKEKQVEINDKGHMWDRAKWMHDWTARILLLRDRYNIHIIGVEHQNEDGPGGGGAKGPSFLPTYFKELNHRTKPGGQAVNQITNLQMTLADKGYIYSAGEKVARRIVMLPYKNSYGSQNRTCCFALKPDPYNDTDEFLDGGCRWDYTEVEWLAECGHLGMRKTGDTQATERFTCATLGAVQLSLVEAAQAWREAPQALVEELGRKLQIPGYINVYDTVIRKLGKEGK